MKIGLQSLGHEVKDYYISLNTQRLSDEPFFDKTLGFMTNKMLDDFKNEMKDKDLLIFIHPCPTKTKAFDSERWMECYKTGKPTIVIVHDPFIDQYYKWFLQVKQYVTGIACIQRKGYDAIKKYFENVVITNHFLDLTGMGLYEEKKEDLVISPHQFKTWKYIDIFIRSIPLFECDSEVFNGGIEYHYMSGSMEKRKEKYKDSNGNWIWEEAIKAGMKYRGHVTDQEITSAFQRSKAVIDLSVGELGNKLSKLSIPSRQLSLFEPTVATTELSYKSLNYVPLEAMKYGAIPIVRNYSLLDGIVTEENVVVVDEDNLVENTALAINDVILSWDAYEDMRKKNFTLLKTHYNNEENAKKLLKLLH